jgi:hypothetical protein
MFRFARANDKVVARAKVVLIVSSSRHEWERMKDEEGKMTPD